MKIQIPILGVMCVAFLLLGCTSATRNVSEPTETVTSISLEYLSNGTNYRNSNLTYKLVPMKGSEFDLRLIKIGKEIKRVLKSSGVEESNNPDIIVFFDFGSGGIKEVEHSIPYAIRGQTGIVSSTTTGTIYGNSVNMRTTVTPTYGVIGHGEHKYTTYIDSHYLALMAIDARSLAKGEPKQLWTAILTSSGKLFDENLSLKSMLMAIKDKIGTTQDSAYSLHMKKSQIINPPHEMDLDVDAVAYKADYYLKQANKLIDSRLPQPYSLGNRTQSLVGKVKNWTVFCQSADNVVNGCGMSDVGITVFIDAKSHAPIVIVGEHEYLAPESEVCVGIDGERSCVTVEAYNADLPSSKQKIFRENAFWKLEKAKKVEVVYTFYKENMRNVNAVDMDYYLKALDVLRRSLP